MPTRQLALFMDIQLMNCDNSTLHTYRLRRRLRKRQSVPAFREFLYDITGKRMGPFFQWKLVRATFSLATAIFKWALFTALPNAYALKKNARNISRNLAGKTQNWNALHIRSRTTCEIRL